MRLLEKEGIMATAALNLASLLEDIPRGAWVAVSEDRQHVVAYGADMRDVLMRAREMGEKNPIIMRVPETPNSLLL